MYLIKYINLELSSSGSKIKRFFLISSLIVLHLGEFRAQCMFRFVENKTTLSTCFDRTNETTRLLLFGYGRVVLRRYKTNSFRDSQNGLLIDMASSAVDRDRYEPFEKC